MEHKGNVERLALFIASSFLSALDLPCGTVLAGCSTNVRRLIFSFLAGSAFVGARTINGKQNESRKTSEQTSSRTRGTREMEKVRSRGGLRTNSFAHVRKLFVDKRPVREIEELGSAEALLSNRT